MPTENVLTRQQEKPNHYNYLKSFRVEQCKDFQQHQCTQHKPYTCFNWHFPNQKRRRPVLNTKDGHFNYSPDQYCTKYDESNGVCPDGDGCPFLHRNLGDSERRYHLRYFKVELCSGEVDSHGICAKNGIHCSFAHSLEDRRQPVFDIMEHRMVKGTFLGSSGLSQAGSEGDGLSQPLDKNIGHALDPQWNDPMYMVSHYKVDPCKITGRHNMVLCPYYHFSREKRRNIATHKYRAVACAMVKDKDDWLEPTSCELGDSCSYSHTRMELQYHPDVFRTVACQKEQKAGSCNKGVFCAFAHDSIMPALKEPPKASMNTLDPVTELSPLSIKTSAASSSASMKDLTKESSSAEICPITEDPTSLSSAIALPAVTASDMDVVIVSEKPLPQPIGPPSRTSVISSTMASAFTSSAAAAALSASTAVNPQTYLSTFLTIDVSAPPFSAAAPPSLPAPLSINTSVGHQSIASQLKSSLANLPSAIGQSDATTLQSAGRTELSSTGSDHALDALDDDFGKGVTKSPPPGFAKKVLTSESVEILKLKSELAELRLELQTALKEKEQAEFEKIEALKLLDMFRNGPPIDDSQYLQCLLDNLELEKINLSSLVQVQAKLHKDLKRVNKVMVNLISLPNRCRCCKSRVAGITLDCGHVICSMCFITESKCPTCGIIILSSVKQQQLW